LTSPSSRPSSSHRHSPAASSIEKIVDESISQAGSLVAFDRLRFDFNCPRPITEELQQIEEQVNNWIGEAHAAHVSEMPLTGSRLKVRSPCSTKSMAIKSVLDIPGVSMELCGGTHVRNTAEIGF